MQELPQSDDFKSIVLNNTPLIDVRAPIEFNKGAFKNCVNLPLMNDEERHLVGIKYKEHGNVEAIKLGHKLVKDEIKESRVKAWCDYKMQHPNALLYCFRGGQRSKISQEWMRESKIDITRLRGGYKAFRSYLMREIEESPKHFKPIIIGGRTGSGKTILLKDIKNSIDLEGLANHRGSSFGRKITPQPTQINFENALAYDLIQKLDYGFKELYFEDEGKYVGGVCIPKEFAEYLSSAPLIILETPESQRIEITFDEYVVQAQTSYKSHFEKNALQEWAKDIGEAMKRINRRLGLERYKVVCELFEDALNEQMKNNSLNLYKTWVKYLLNEYYDPMYDYQIEKNASRIVFRGNSEEILSYVKEKSSGI
ncbi:tRNA 2-selenouridine(34) synthase MnmH [Sulfurimonas aquatica]|uniref:tRNA 2-selenouridine(34) synthase MnmH n=1 Tax=Sulfurimonas aquatica TaxID=2672570 RepID=A0A975GCW5_9BACT|nr:tRNA 2-selenouridine(34) synthase MnmH [Sulfurimonas aquatica]QSZ41947.1 tRNA 2-selenouridine(34) synthase MnmH [Sulfurimonas aquatica]